MTLPLLAGPNLSGTVVTAGPGNAQAVIDAAANGTEIRLGSGTYVSQLHVWSRSDILIRLMPGCTLRGGGVAGYYALHFDNAVRCAVIGDPAALIRNPNGHGVGANGGSVTISRCVINGCGGSGIQCNSGGGQQVQIDRNNLSDNGDPSSLPGDPTGYWRYGTHGAYAGGGSDYTATRAYVYDNHIHDQHSGYGIELGGQSQNSIVAWNLIENVDGAADTTPGILGDRLGNATQVFSSYAGSTGNLIVNNLWRDIAGYGAAGDATSTQGVVRNNVGWNMGLGLVHTTHGAFTVLTDGGANVTQNLTSLLDCLDGGFFDAAYVPDWLAATPPAPSAALYGFDENTSFPGYPSNSPFATIQAQPWYPATQGTSNMGALTRDSSLGVPAFKFDLTGTVSGGGATDRSQAYYVKTLDENTTRVFSYEFWFPSRATSMGSNYLLTETGYMVYQTFGPPSLLYWVWNGGSPYVIFHMQTGELGTSPVYEYNTTNGQGGAPMDNYAIPAADYAPDVWHQLVVAIYQRRTADGTVEIWHRKRGDVTWDKTVDISGAKTIQLDGGVPPSTTVLDLVNAYRLHSTNAAHHYTRSFFRWETTDDAFAYFGTAAPPPPPTASDCPVETVTFAYDGAMEVVATITDAEPGVSYSMYGYTLPSGVSDTAVTSTLVLTMSDFAPVDGQANAEIVVQRDDTGDFVGTTVFVIGVATPELSTPAITWNYIAPDAVQATFTTVLDQEYRVQVNTPILGGQTDIFFGTGGSDTFELTSGTDLDGQCFAAFVYENAGGIHTFIGARLFCADAEGAGFLGNPGGGGDQPEPTPDPGPATGGCGGGAAWSVQAGRFFESPTWRILVTDLTGAAITVLDRHAFNRRIEYVLNGPAVGTGSVNSDDPQVNIIYDPPDPDPYMSEGNRLMYWFRREGDDAGTTFPGPWVCRHAGLVQIAEDTAETENATTGFTCYDPWQRLYRVPIVQANGDLINHRTGFYRVPPDLAPPGGGDAADEIALAILAFACAQINGFPFLIDVPEPWCGASGFYTGTIEPCANVDVEFQEGMSVAEGWEMLTETGLIDIILEPIYDPIQRPGYTHQINIYNVAGEIRPEAIFSWDKPVRSLTRLTRQLDGTQRQNHIQFYTSQANSAGTPVEDAVSTAKYGGYWGQQVFPSTRIASAVDQLAIKRAQMMANGLRTFTMSPAPTRSPLLFTEWFLGDRVPIYASSRFRASIPPADGVPMHQRVVGIPVSISDNALESVEDCLITPDGWVEPG